MNLFKFCTLENVQNNQTTSKNVFKCVFMTISESTPKKIFETSRTTSKNFFDGVFMIIFRNIHHKKCSKQPNVFK